MNVKRALFCLSLDIVAQVFLELTMVLFSDHIKNRHASDLIGFAEPKDIQIRFITINMHAIVHIGDCIT